MNRQIRLVPETVTRFRNLLNSGTYRLEVVLLQNTLQTLLGFQAHNVRERCNFANATNYIVVCRVVLCCVTQLSRVVNDCYGDSLLSSACVLSFRCSFCWSPTFCFLHVEHASGGPLQGYVFPHLVHSSCGSPSDRTQ